MNRDLGDFQTPPELVRAALDCLGPIGERWPRVLEPTCGRGNFIRGLLNSPSPPLEIQGFELQDVHLHQARQYVGVSAATIVRVDKANIFDLDLKREVKWRTDGPLLVIGNPPWVTNAELGALESANLPRKSNLKGLSGLEAITGSSNFDLAEFIWLKLIRELADQRPTIALLCKTSVARNVLQFARDNSVPVARAWLRCIDAKKHFEAAVDAGLFCLEIHQGKANYEAALFKDLSAPEPESIMSVINGRVIMDREAHRRTAFIDGNCPLVWRQGIKHDAASVLELRDDGERLRNKLGEPVEIEDEYLYPLLKCGDLFHFPPESLPRRVIVTQRRIGEETRGLQLAAPKLWRYLNDHAEVFARRRSSIYRGQPPFALFGLGDYSFARFKVGISGLHKAPRFRFIGPLAGRPVMLDDASYFIPCQCARQAALIAALLNQKLALEFVRAIMFSDAKRPITKRLLQRIDLVELLRRGSRQELLKAAEQELLSWPERAEDSDWPWPEDLATLLTREPSPGRHEDQMNLFAVA